MTTTSVIVSVAFATAFILAVLMRFVDGKGTPVRAFSRCSLLVSVSFLGLGILLIGDDPLWAKVGSQSAVLAVVFLPPQLLQLAGTFGRGSRGFFFARARGYVIASYGLAFIFSYLTLTQKMFLLPSAVGSRNIILLLRPAALYLLVFLILIFLLLMVGLEAMFRALNDDKRKRQLKALLAGSMIAFFFGITTICYIFVTGVVSVDVVRAVGITSTISSFVLAGLVIRLRAVQENMVLSREAVYSSAMFLVVGATLIVIGVGAKILRAVGGDPGVFFSVFAAFAVLILLAAIITSASIKERIKAFVDRAVYKGTYDYRELWRSFTERISGSFELDEMIDRILSFVGDLLGTEEVAILLSDQGSGDIVLQGYTGYRAGNPPDKETVRLSAACDFADWLWRWAKPVTVAHLEGQHSTRRFLDEHRPFFEALKVHICVPLIAQGDLVGLMALGDRKQSKKYRYIDLELLEILADHTAMAILTNRLNTELLASKEMESFYKISSFIVHDLRNAVSRLSMALENAREHIADQDFQRDLLQTISVTVSDMKQLLLRLSSAAEGLEVVRTPVDLDRLVHQVLVELSLVGHRKVILEEELRTAAALMLDGKHIRQLLMNLVLNAVEAMPSGGRLRVSTELISQSGDKEMHVRIRVEDTGMGMSHRYIREELFKPFASTKKNGLGLGLFQCLEIVKAHGGRIEVTSTPGKGSAFSVTLPARIVAAPATEEPVLACS